MAVQTYPVPPVEAIQIKDASETIINPLTEESFSTFLSTIILNHVRDPNNTRTAPFFDNEIYEGTFTKISDWSSTAVAFVSDQAPLSAEIVWSDDGITPVVNSLTPSTPIPFDLQDGLWVGLIPLNSPFHPYLRVKLDYTGITNTFISGVFTLLSQDPLQPTTLGLNEAIPTFAFGNMTRAILGGLKQDGLLKPTTEFKNVALTQDEALITASPGASLFTYASPPQPAIPSGAVPVIHPVLNTEANTLDSGWLASPSYAGGQEFNLIADQAGVDVYFLNSHDDQGVHMVNDGAPFLTTVAPGVPVSLSAAMFGKRFFRVVAVNRSGSTVNKISLSSHGNQVPTPPFFSGIDQPFFTFTPAAAGKTAMFGRVPGTDLMKLMEITSAGFLNTSSSDFLREVSLGRVASHTTATVTARNLAVPTGVFEDIWIVGGDYPYPTTAATLDVSSLSINDTAGGSGARTLKIRGLDVNYNEIEETITLNGLTPVTTANSYLRLTEATVATVGSSGGNEGLIDIKHGVDVIGRMSISANRTQLSQFTVPAGKTGLLVYEQASTGIGDDVELDFVVRENGTSDKPFVPRQGVIATEGSLGQSVYATVPITEKSDIKWRAKKIGLGTADVSIEYRLLLIDNEVV